MTDNRDLITLSDNTISNPESIEYQWVRSMHHAGYSGTAINHYIQTCFGGDFVFAELFRKVALNEESIYLLMQHVGCAPSSKEF